jgi:hypothetical protein
MGMETGAGTRADFDSLAGPSLRTRDQLVCIELASQAMDAYFDRTWEQLEPLLESTWENSDSHEMSWCEARWFVKCAWTDCLNRGAAARGEFRATV